MFQKLFTGIKKIFAKENSIFIIDDDDEICMLLSMAFKSLGYKTNWARDGLEGLKAIEKTVPDLIVLDITMPKMDGFEVLFKLKSNPKTQAIPVVMCTEHSAIKDVEKCCKWGAVGYILKPFEMQRVLQKVSSILNKNAQAD